MYGMRMRKRRLLGRKVLMMSSQGRDLLPHSHGLESCEMQLGSFLKCEKKSLLCNVEYSWSCCFDTQTDTLKVIKMPRLRGKFFIPATVHATLFDHFFVFSF